MRIIPTISAPEGPGAVSYTHLDVYKRQHLANLPVYYEYKADGITSTDAIKGTYLDNYKQIFDPVSYTHLDVYKRQPKIWLTSGSFQEMPK